MILIVDDERDLREILAFNLSRSGYQTLEAASAEEADALIAEGVDVQLILLDVMMGGRNGFEFAADLRERGECVPIIFLTALDTEGDVLRGFKLGADDYISKPFSVAEVLARVSAVLARTATVKVEKLAFADIELNLDSKTVRIKGSEVCLTKTEFALLRILVDRPTKTFSREELLDKVWGRDVFVESRTVDVHIARLRKKIESSAVQIVSRSGYGYSLSAENS